MKNIDIPVFARTWGRLVPRIIEHGLVDGDASWTWPDAPPAQYHRLYLFYRGSAGVHHKNSKIRFRPKTAYLLPAGQPYSMVADGYFCKFYLHLSFGLPPALDPLSSKSIRHVPIPLALNENAVRSMLRKRGILDSQQFFLAVMQLMTPLLDPAALKRFGAALVFEPWKPFMDYLNTTPYENISLGAWIRAQGQSVDGFTKRLKRSLGLTPQGLLTHVFKERTIQLLADPDLRVREIAQQLGFSNEFNFSRFFKKATGYAPQIFRERSRWGCRR